MASIIDADRLGQGNGPSTVPRRLVVPLSSHWDTQRALPAAIWLAAQAEAPMLLVSVVIDAARVGDRHDDLDALAGELRTRGLDVATLVRRSDEVASVIVEEANRRPGSVICMPTHGPGRMAELAIGTVTQDVVDHAAGPVVLTGPCVEAIAAPRRLVAALDDTTVSHRAASLAGDWARTFGVALELVEVLGGRLDERFGRGDVLESATLQQYASDLRAPGFEPSWEVLHGRDRSEAIVDHLDHRLDAWLVVGTHARTGIPRLGQGSVAMQIVHRSPVPVVVVR